MILMYFILMCFFISCKQENKIQNSTQNSVAKQLQKANAIESDWQEGFGLTHNIDIDSIWYKPVRYYIENKECDSTAINFYYGKYGPSDEPRTAQLLALVTTENNKLRPFYRWILNKTILIQDGALGEYTGVPARKYAEQFPKEFFEYMDSDTTNTKYTNWCNSVQYSGFYDFEDTKNIAIIRKKVLLTMNQNCSNCDETTKRRIIKFTSDCFPN